MKDFYYILGTARNATMPEIEAAYQKLARKFGQKEEEEQDEFIDSHLSEISEAYDVLRDAGRRRKYDSAFLNNQKRHLSVLKLKHINIAVTLIFLIITALLARYVIIASASHISKKVPVKAVQPATLVTIHHPKKQRRLPVVINTSSANLKPMSARDTLVRQAARVTQPVAPTMVSDSTYITSLHANITGIVYLHQYAGYRFAVLARVPGSAQIKVLQKGAAWYKVMYKDTVGYVLKSSVQKP